MIISFTASPAMFYISQRARLRKNNHPLRELKEWKKNTFPNVNSSYHPPLFFLFSSGKMKEKQGTSAEALLSLREIYNHVGLIVQGWLENIAVPFLKSLLKNLYSVFYSEDILFNLSKIYQHFYVFFFS